MNSLAELFNVEDFSGKNRKGAGKAGKKAEAEKKKEGKKKEIRYPLPIRICSGPIQCVMTSEQFNEETLDEGTIKTEIRREYPELGEVQFNLVKFQNVYTDLLEKTNAVKGRKETMTVADVETEDPLDIAEAIEAQEDYENLDEEDMGYLDIYKGDEDGEAKKQTGGFSDLKRGCWIKLDIFYQEVKKEQEIVLPVIVKAGKYIMEIKGTSVRSLKEISAVWVKEYPEYRGCRFYYDEKNHFLVPYLTGEGEVKGKKYSLPTQVGFLDQKETYTVKDFGETGSENVDWKELRALYAKKHPEYENASVVYHEELDLLFPVLEFKKEVGNERIALPIKVRGSGFVLELTEEDFKGSASATLDEIRAVIEEVYPEFSKERTEMIYDERGFVIPVLKGSRKGMVISYVRKNQGFYEVTGRDGRRYRIEQMPYGCFESSEDGKIDFYLMTDKIPAAFLEQIIAFFQKNPRKEAAVQIFFDPKKDCYELYFPKQTVSANSVEFQRNHDLESEKVLVMDVHSHGCMPAFFSGIDNHDEKGTRLFLVFGNLDKEKTTYMLRAGIAGNYKRIALSRIFDLKED